MPTSTASTHAGELAELGFDEAAENAVVLLEWPDRAADVLPADRLDIAFTLAPHLGAEPAQRRAHRLRRVRAARSSGWPRSATSSPTRAWPTRSARIVQGDASTRAYERLDA